ncbi:MAG: thymidine phosphorylase, partial [Archaeoglobaceae archaeon]
MKLKLRILPLRSEKLSAVLNPRDAEELGLMPGDRVKVVVGKESFVAELDVSGILEEGEIGICSFTAETCKIEEECSAEVIPVSRPKAVEFIRKKLDGAKLTSHEMKTIISDISKNVL